MPKYKIENFLLIIIFIVAFLLCADRSFAAPTPPMPCDFYGYEQGAGILKAGDKIIAKDPNGVICGSCTVTTNGQYGFLSCKADDPSTPDIDEGATEGDTITLFLNGAEVINKGIWTQAGTVRVDIGNLIESEQVATDIHVDFNQIGFSVIPQSLLSPYKASQLIQDMAAQGITINVVMQWDGAVWIPHQHDLPFTDFNLNLNQGIFVSAVSGTYHAGTWTITGRKIQLPKTFNFYQGWNLVAIPTTISATTAIGVLNQINSQGGAADVMMYWDGAVWVSSQADLPFTNQNLVKGRSYFIRCSHASTWQMQ